MYNCDTFLLENALPNFPVDHKIYKLAKERVTLVRTLDKLEHRMNRLNAQNRWITKTAEEMDIDIDDENLYPFHLNYMHKLIIL